MQDENITNPAMGPRPPLPRRRAEDLLHMRPPAPRYHGYPTTVAAEGTTSSASSIGDSRSRSSKVIFEIEELCRRFEIKELYQRGDPSVQELSAMTSGASSGRSEASSWPSQTHTEKPPRSMPSMMASGWRVVSSTLLPLEEDHPGGTRSKAASMSVGFREA